MKRIILALASVPAIATCTAEPSTPLERWSVRDSGGITIVDNLVAGAADTFAVVGDEPTTVIGGLRAGDEEQLFRIQGALRLPDGRLAVASAGTYDVRVFGADGTPNRRWGQEGEGPDEFQDPSLVGRFGADTLVVFDSSAGRLSLVHPEAGFVGSRSVEWTGQGFPVGRGLLGDGSLLIGGGMSFSSSEGFPTGVIRPPSSFGWVSRDGLTRILGDYPAAEMYARASDQGFMARGLPFARVTVAAAGPDGVWIGTGDSWELVHHGLDGRPDHVLRTDQSPRRVSDADRRRNVRQEVAGASTDNEARRTRELLAEMPYPEHYPPYQAILVDSGGNLWVENYLAPGETEPAWMVFDSEGRWVGGVRTPNRTRILEIGEDYILGRTLDELEVESLTLWSLTRLR